MSDSRRWHTLSHRGPLFPRTHAVDPVGTGTGTCADRLRRLDVPGEAKVAVRRMREILARRTGTTGHEKEAFSQRFWQTWVEQYLPSCAGVTPTQSLAKRLADAAFTEQSRGSQVGYSTACVDGKELPIANFRVEAPGVFAGRGADHPFAGRVKRKLRSSNVTINLDAGAKVHAPSDGGRWAGVVHDQGASWLASWRDPATGKTKYMRLADRSREDIAKFDLARRVARALPIARAKVTKGMARLRGVPLQHACCLLLLDRFALRIGAPADRQRVFGATTLKSEHVRLIPPSTISLSFPGKDSVPCLAEGQVSKGLFDGMTTLGPALFASTNDASLNRFIEGREVLGPGVTAKAIRTARACETYESALEQHHPRPPHAGDAQAWRSVAVERLAVVEVAMLCNHRRGSVVGDPARERAALMEAYGLVSSTGTRSAVRTAIAAACVGMNLSTAPGNYLDPRITRAYETRQGLPAGACSSPANRRKFAWANSTSRSWSFKGAG